METVLRQGWDKPNDELATKLAARLSSVAADASYQLAQGEGPGHVEAVAQDPPEALNSGGGAVEGTRELLAQDPPEAVDASVWGDGEQMVSTQPRDDVPGDPQGPPEAEGAFLGRGGEQMVSVQPRDDASADPEAPAAGEDPSDDCSTPAVDSRSRSPQPRDGATGGSSGAHSADDCANPPRARTGDIIASPNMKNVKGATPLHLVCAAGSLPGLSLLLDHGADVDAFDADGRTALHIACAQTVGGEPLVRKLLEAGADPGRMDNSGDRPLHVAAAHGCEGCVGLLLRKGAASGVSNHSGDTPLHVAAAFGRLAVMQQLVLGSTPEAAPMPPDPSAVSTRPSIVTTSGLEPVRDCAAEVEFTAQEDASVAVGESERGVSSAAVQASSVTDITESSQDAAPRRLLGELFDPPRQRTHTDGRTSEYLSYSSDSTLEASDTETFGSPEAPVEGMTWTRCWTATGDVYFVSHATGESQWEEPVGAVSIVDQHVSVDVTGRATLAEVGTAGGAGAEEEAQWGEAQVGLDSQTVESLEQEEPQVAQSEAAQEVWKQDIDEDGNTYFFSESGETAWELPAGVILDDKGDDAAAGIGQGEVEGSAEVEWVEHWDETSQHSYWENVWTGESSWEHPEQSAAEARGEVGAQEWAEQWDDDGNGFWVNTLTGQTAFEGEASGVETVVESGETTGQGGAVVAAATVVSDVSGVDVQESKSASSAAVAPVGNDDDNASARTLEVWNKFFENALRSNLPQGVPLPGVSHRTAPASHCNCSYCLQTPPLPSKRQPATRRC